MKSFFVCTALGAALLAISAGGFAAGGAGSTRSMQQSPAMGATTTRSAPPTTLSPAHVTGQPNQNCETSPATPGNAAAAPGSAFNPTPGTAGQMYAGQQPQNSRNTASVSQYDVACSHQR